MKTTSSRNSVGWPVGVAVLAFSLGWLARRDINRPGMSSAPEFAGPRQNGGDRAELAAPPASTEPLPVRSAPAPGPDTGAVRLIRDLPYADGGGRSAQQIFLDWWGNDLAASGHGPEGPSWLRDEPSDFWHGPLGEVAPCLEYYRGLFEGAFDADDQSPDPLALIRLAAVIPGQASGIRVPEKALKGLLAVSPFEEHFRGRTLDKKSPEWKLAIQTLLGDLESLHGLVEDVRDAMRRAVREDLAGLSPYQLPRKGYLNFGPCNVFVHPDAAARPCREPQILWRTDLMPLKGKDANMCRVFVGVYTVFWEDFPEVASKIQAVLDYKAGFIDRVSAVILAIPAS